jgi:3-oxoacyl-[acyl-carrier protein] reductase
MDLGLTGKKALVAAASKGLGKATALALAREGVDVCIVARGQDVLQAAADEIRRATGRSVLALPTDVSSAQEVQALMTRVGEAFGSVDILVNNAGGPRPGVFTDMSDEDWLAAMELNLMSSVRLTRLALPGMRANKWGRIINITSVAVKQPMPTLILSNAARSAVVAMAKTLAGQVAADGVTVNNVCPGYTLTDRMRSLAESSAAREQTSPETIMSRWELAVPARRLGKPEEVAALITFLASQQAAYITGTTIQVDGGLTQGLL